MVEAIGLKTKRLYKIADDLIDYSGQRSSYVHVIEKSAINLKISS